MSNFKVGEIAIGQNFKEHTECNGMECEIVGEYGTYICFHPSHFGPFDVVGYKVVWANGRTGVALRHHLRKKYDGDDTVDWEDCVWKPTEEVA